MTNSELNQIFLQKFCAGLRITESNMVLSYDYNRGTRALIRLGGAYHIDVQEVSEATDYKWATIAETSVSLSSNLSLAVANLKPKKAEEDE